MLFPCRKYDSIGKAWLMRKLARGTKPRFAADRGGFTPVKVEFRKSRMLLLVSKVISAHPYGG
jgi:hypothetical protein